MPDTAIVWFRRDLRLYDNAALARACQGYARILPVYVYAPQEEAPWPPGAASRWWLHHSLASLDRQLRERGARLWVWRGASLPVLMRLCQAAGARAVYWNRLYDPAIAARDAGVAQTLQANGLRTRSFAGHLVREPGEVMTGGGTPYRVFTPYARASFALDEPPAPQSRSDTRIAGAAPTVPDDGLESLALLPRVRWDTGIAGRWQPGEAAAWQRAESFIDSAARDYREGRDRLGEDGVSRISPHLHFGEISARALWHAVHQALAGATAESAAHAYLRQLLWRDFAHQLLHHYPRITEHNFKPAFDDYPWREDSPLIEAWRRGATGIPLVDAGMRELWHSGFMHNRARMVTASFLTKNAGVHWRVGARWFWDTLVDADLANNTMGWQWVAGSGPDAAPWFRIFNPATQGRRFDTGGAYVRRWVPEIAGLPDRHLHSPWAAPSAVLSRAGVELEVNYPGPVVDLKDSRRRALEAYDRHVKNA